MKLLLLLILFYACSSQTENLDFALWEQNQDIVVVAKTIPFKIRSPSYREKEYFVASANDTSNFSCIFSENIKNGRISIDCEYDAYTKRSLKYSTDTAPTMRMDESKVPYYKVTYRQQIDEFKIILKKSTEDFDLSNVKFISFELLQSGDLSIDITNQYIKEFGRINTSDYKGVKDIIKKSSLIVDLNHLFEPYSVVAEKISIEKLFFYDKKYLYKASKIETDSTEVSM